MKIQCENCGTQHELDPPSWVVSSGRAFRFRCSACGHSQSVQPDTAVRDASAIAAPTEVPASRTVAPSGPGGPASRPQPPVASPPRPTLTPPEDTRQHPPQEVSRERAPASPPVDARPTTDVVTTAVPAAVTAAVAAAITAPFPRPPPPTATPPSPASSRESPRPPVAESADSAVYLKQNGQIYRVQDWDTLRRWIDEGRVDQNDLVSEGGVRWEPIGSRQDLVGRTSHAPASSVVAVPAAAPPSATPFPFGGDSPFATASSQDHVWTDDDTEGVPTGLPPLPTEESVALDHPHPPALPDDSVPPFAMEATASEATGSDSAEVAGPASFEGEVSTTPSTAPSDRIPGVLSAMKAGSIESEPARGPRASSRGTTGVGGALPLAGPPSDGEPGLRPAEVPHQPEALPFPSPPPAPSGSPPPPVVPEPAAEAEPAGSGWEDLLTGEEAIAPPVSPPVPKIGTPSAGADAATRRGSAHGSSPVPIAPARVVASGEFDAAWDQEVAESSVAARWWPAAAALTLVATVLVLIGLFVWPSSDPAPPSPEPLPRPGPVAAAPTPSPEPAAPSPAPVPTAVAPKPVPPPPRPVPAAPVPAAPRPAPVAPVPAPGPSAQKLAERGWGLAEGQPADAQRLFREALDLQSGNELAAYGLGYTLILQGRANDALPWLCRVQTSRDAEIAQDARGMLASRGLTCP